MMLLADLKSIRIKAKYSEDTAETRFAVLVQSVVESPSVVGCRKMSNNLSLM